MIKILPGKPKRNEYLLSKYLLMCRPRTRRVLSCFGPAVRNQPPVHKDLHSSLPKACTRFSVSLSLFISLYRFYLPSIPFSLSPFLHPYFSPSLFLPLSSPSFSLFPSLLPSLPPTLLPSPSLSLASQPPALPFFLVLSPIAPCSEISATASLHSCILPWLLSNTSALYFRHVWLQARLSAFPIRLVVGSRPSSAFERELSPTSTGKKRKKGKRNDCSDMGLYLPVLR